jgi:hypothetical protein
LTRVLMESRVGFVLALIIEKSCPPSLKLWRIFVLLKGRTSRDSFV